MNHDAFGLIFAWCLASISYREQLLLTSLSMQALINHIAPHISVARIGSVQYPSPSLLNTFLKQAGYQVQKLLSKLKQRYLLTSAYHQTKEEMEAEYAIIVKSQKNPQRFGPIYERYYDSIFIFINRRLDDEEASADVASIVFYKCLENIKKFKFQGVPFSAWLFRIAVNEVNQFFRRQKKHDRAVSIQERHINILFEEMEEDPEDKHQVVSQLLSSLSPDDLQFLELRFFEGHSFREMGYLLGLTEVNAKIKTYRILKKMKAKAQELYPH